MTALSFETLAGNMGRGLTIVQDDLWQFPDAVVAMDDVCSMEVVSLDMGHSPFGPTKGGLPFAGVMALSVGVSSSWYMARYTCQGDMLEVVFSIEAEPGKYALAKADGETFAQLRQLYMGDEEE